MTRPLIAAALQFVLGHPCVKTVVPGAVNAKEVRSQRTRFWKRRNPKCRPVVRICVAAGLIHPRRAAAKGVEHDAA